MEIKSDETFSFQCQFYNFMNMQKKKKKKKKKDQCSKQALCFIYM